MLQPFEGFYRERLRRFGDSPKSVGYLVPAWARFERLAVRQCLEDASGRLLDVGCGIGFMTRDLSPRFRVIGADLSVEHLRFCPRSADFIPVAADGFHLPFSSESFDVVVCANVLQCFDYTKGFELLVELVRMVRPDGRVILVARNGTSIMRRFSYPLYRLYNRARGVTEPPLFGYDASAVSQEMASLGCHEQAVNYLFPPLRLMLGFRGRHLGTSVLLSYQKATPTA